MVYSKFMSRRAAVLALAEAKGREELALHLNATSTADVSVEDIRRILQKEPAPQVAPPVAPVAPVARVGADPVVLARLAREAAKPKVRVDLVAEMRKRCGIEAPAAAPSASAPQPPASSAALGRLVADMRARCRAEGLMPADEVKAQEPVGGAAPRVSLAEQMRRHLANVRGEGPPK